MQSVSTTNVFGGWRASAKGIQPCEAQPSTPEPQYELIIDLPNWSPRYPTVTRIYSH